MSEHASSPEEPSAEKKTVGQKTRSQRKPRRKRKAKGKTVAQKGTNGRTVRSFPASSFEEPLEFAKSILAFGAGQAVRRLTLFDHLGKSPESGPSRQLITNASKYGLISGSYKSDQLSLTPDGLTAADDAKPAKEVARTRARLAIEDIHPFKSLYDSLLGNKLPAKAALIDLIQKFGVTEAAAEEGVDTFIVNLRFVGLLRTLSGAERVVPVEHLLENLSDGATPNPTTIREELPPINLPQDSGGDFSKTCFYITPIGIDGSEQRKHSDLFLGSLVEPAVEPFGLKVVRADGIDTPGIITRQIVDYLLKSKLVIADLSFHNPNVFYELALRHASRLPIVQIIRGSESVPFDVNQMRTVVIDTSDIYSLVPKLELYRSEIANQVRRALEAGEAVDTPISVHFPGLRVSLGDPKTL
jgi:hypothetical protein